MFSFQPTPADQNMNLSCKWSKPDCLKKFASAEELFNHLCDCHVGRKRNGNLSLNCSWEGCDHKAAKRDHMTSHMMVHCPLQTNVCGICEKTFKRSYDLRKHEVTHTVAHHELHTRSRAVVYQELEVPFPTEMKPSPTPMNRVRVHSLPREQSREWNGPQVQPAVPGAVHRERSFSVPRHNPYPRPQSSDQASYSLYPTSWNNEFKFPSERHQRSDSIAEEGPYNVNMPLFNQFQFMEQYPQPADSLAPDLFNSSVPPSTSSGSSSSSNQPNTYSNNPPGDWSEIFSFVHDTRRESEPYSIPSEDFSGSEGLSGMFGGAERCSEVLRTSSLSGSDALSSGVYGGPDPSPELLSATPFSGSDLISGLFAATEPAPEMFNPSSFSGSDGLAGVFGGGGPLRTSSLPCRELQYPAASTSSFNAYENLGFRHSLSAPVTAEPANFSDFQIREFLAQHGQPQPYQHAFLEPLAQYQPSEEEFLQLQNYACVAHLDTLLSLADLGGLAHPSGAHDQSHAVLLDLPPFQYPVPSSLF
ncbi:hypothetical protein PGTUg99_013944 [Puccinia graminis f. sp. tritici]|uniref:C2H2-type domain-containing protein n=1 Tax=Puccinia graminis f. sp. tritici TaxID=56615 RepID=A0A5B0QGU8_PUCGR|nr:hypothetical protein PGTUg99_013944 [Puccinia graminis f. sp. tritici]